MDIKISLPFVTASIGLIARYRLSDTLADSSSIIRFAPEKPLIVASEEGKETILDLFTKVQLSLLSSISLGFVDSLFEKSVTFLNSSFDCLKLGDISNTSLLA